MLKPDFVPVPPKPGKLRMFAAVCTAFVFKRSASYFGVAAIIVVVNMVHTHGFWRAFAMALVLGCLEAALARAFKPFTKRVIDGVITHEAARDHNNRVAIIRGERNPKG